jgi:hypothetical protein
VEFVMMICAFACVYVDVSVVFYVCVCSADNRAQRTRDMSSLNDETAAVERDNAHQSELRE